MDQHTFDANQHDHAQHKHDTLWNATRAEVRAEVIEGDHKEAIAETLNPEDVAPLAVALLFCSTWDEAGEEISQFCRGQWSRVEASINGWIDDETNRRLDL